MKDLILQALGSEPVISLALTVAGTAVAALCGTLRAKVKRNSEIDQLLHFVEKGVDETYETYVRELKTGGAKLSKEQRFNARQKARAYAIQKAQDEGVDLVERLGSTALSNWISRLVADKKAAAQDTDTIGPIEAAAPAYKEPRS